MGGSPIERRAIVAALVTVLFWSSAFSGIRIALESYSPEHLALLRFLAASLAFVIYAVVRRLPVPPREDWPRFIALGLCGVTIYHMFLNIGQQTVPAGTAGLIIATVPVFAAILSSIFLRERLLPLGWVGLLLSLMGIVIMTFGGNSEVGFALGVLFIVGSAITGAVHLVLVKPVLARYNAIDVAAYSTWAGTIPLLIFAPGFVEAVGTASSTATWVGIYIGVFPAAVSYATWGTALTYLPVSRAAVFMYLVSPLALLWGWLWAGEQPTFVTLVGGLVALTGVIIVQVWGRKGDPSRAPDASTPDESPDVGDTGMSVGAAGGATSAGSGAIRR